MRTNDDILNELRDLTPIADQLTPQMPYQVPSGYFDRFADDTLRLIKAQNAGSVDEELEILSPLLSRVNKKTLFTVPEGYFNDFTGTLPGKSNNAPKVVQGNFQKKIVRYSMAAAIAGIIAVAGWFWINTSTTQQPSLTAGNTEELAEKVQNMTDNEMKAFLEVSTTASVYQNTPVLAELKTEDLKLMLADVSDEELQYYTEQSDVVTSVLN